MLDSHISNDLRLPLQHTTLSLVNRLVVLSYVHKPLMKCTTTVQRHHHTDHKCGKNCSTSSV